jgi:hypothetical protein
VVTEPVFFTVEATPTGEVMTPLPDAAGNWSRGRMRGMAISGVLARAAERASPDSSMRPVRWTLDLCRVASMDPCQVDVTILRKGKRLTLIEADLIQRGAVVATGRALFLKPDPDAVTSSVWAPAHHFEPPPASLTPATKEPRLHYIEGVGWSSEPPPHQSASRKRMWIVGFRVVQGEVPSAFQFAASAADLASVVANWGAGGMEFINADVTLALSRLPEGREIGLAAMDRVETDGICASTVAMFDRAGPLGSAVVCSVANLAATVDPRRR